MSPKVTWHPDRGFQVHNADDLLMEALTEMQGGRKSRDGYVVPPAWPVVVRLSELIPREHWVEDALKTAMRCNDHARFLSHLAGQRGEHWVKDAPGDIMPAIRVRGGELSQVQDRGAEWLQESRIAMLCDEMGSGKTVQTCVAMDEISAHETFKALVVAPASVLHAWGEHIIQWTEGVVPIPLVGNAKDRRDLIQWTLENESHFCFVVSWALLSRMSRVAHWPTVERTQAQAEPKELNGIEFDLVVFDEAHRAKNPEALQTRAAWCIEADRRWALTGTPVSERPEDLWALLRLVDPESWPSKRKFVDEFCQVRLDEWGATHVEGWDQVKLGRLSRYVAPYYRRMSMEDAIGRRIDKVRQERVVSLPKAHREQYDLLDKEWKVVAGESETWTDNALSHLTRLTQCALSPLEIEGSQITMIGPSPKVAELRLLLKDLPEDEQVVVFTASRLLHTLAAEMLHRHSISHTVLTGDTSTGDRAERIKRFQEGGARVFLATTQAAGEGVDLTAARTVVHLSKLWSKGMTDQAEDRVRRWTQEGDTVRVIDIIAEGTIEARIERALAKKGALLDAVTPKELV